MAVLLDDSLRPDLDPNGPARPDPRPAELARRFEPIRPSRMDGWPTGPRPAAPPREVWRIERGMKISGDLDGVTDVAIDGEYVGRITLLDRQLSMGAVSSVRADVTAHTVIVRGEFVGTIRASARVLMTGTARVRAEIEAPSVELADGCVFDGTISIPHGREH